MEKQMKAICEGTQTKGDVVYANIEQYQSVYIRSAQQVNVIKSVSRSSLICASFVVSYAL